MAKKTRKEVHEDYDAFTEKFVPKKTTDDCYTPPEVYDEVLRYVNDKILPLEGLRVRRPFYPGGDYQKEADDYGPEDVVVDNPPFSILAKIIDFYTARGVKFFLFAPAQTLFSAPRPGVTYICASAEVVYENKARVRTSFVTNMEGKHRIVVAGDLCQRIEKINSELQQQNRRELNVWNYPIECVTSARLNKVATRGIVFSVPFDECHFVRRLDNAPGGASLYGGGYLLSERAAAERAAAERAAAERAAAEMRRAHCVKLSDRERSIVQSLGKSGEISTNIC